MAFGKVGLKSTIDFDGILNKQINKAYRDALDTALVAYAEWLQKVSPRGVSPVGKSLAGSWDIKVTTKARNQLFAEGSIVNTAEASLFRIVGRGPGKFPPYGDGSPLARWANAVGIPPFLVARAIAERGTERWRDRRNILGIDPRTGQLNDPQNKGLQIFEKVLSDELDKILI